MTTSDRSMIVQQKSILHILEASATGTLSMAALLANSQKKSGHDVSVIYSLRQETPSDLCAYFDSGVKLVHIQMHSLGEKLQSLHLIKKELKKQSPDCVFMHSSFSGFLGRISALFTLTKTKFFYIPHCISFMRQDIGFIKKMLFILFEWVAATKKADYIACSESEQIAIQAAITFRKCHLVENALDFSKIPPMPNMDLAERKKCVITVGQIRPQKGPEKYANITRLVKSVDPSVEFVWVGDGDPQARQELEDAGVHVIGWVPKNRVWQHLGDARLYLSTAQWEGMPVSIIEASFAGLPVVASTCAGNVDVVANGKTGWLFQTPAEASKCILFSLENPELSQSIAKAAFDIAHQRFSVERYFQEMESLIQSKSRYKI